MVGRRFNRSFFVLFLLNLLYVQTACSLVKFRVAADTRPFCFSLLGICFNFLFIYFVVCLLLFFSCVWRTNSMILSKSSHYRLSFWSPESEAGGCLGDRSLAKARKAAALCGDMIVFELRVIIWDPCKIPDHTSESRVKGLSLASSFSSRMTRKVSGVQSSLLSHHDAFGWSHVPVKCSLFKSFVRV